MSNSDLVDDLGFEQANDAFSESIVIGIADCSNGWIDANFDKALGLLDREILRSTV